MKTFRQLRTEINASIWASGTPENLADPLKDGAGNVVAPAPLTMLYQEAMAELSKWVPCERERNTNVIDFCETYFKCGMTAVPAPHGIVTRVYTIANGEWCDPVFYRQTEWPEPECWARNLIMGWANPANAAVLPVLPLGFKRAESTTDRDENGDLIGRARTGIWGLYDERLWVSPWLQSNEKLILEWKGIKKEWSDDDPVNDDQDYRKAVKLYVQYGYERDYGDMSVARTIHDPARGTGTFDEALADLIWECRERTKKQPQKGQCTDERVRLASELVDDEVPA